ncbi:PaaI family thioesterase [Bordetella genomosp. 13]|uniref:PaaI family thioesterase n=1 Tax=Bordetella genomosp. 13 TaxID=463040 RepID=UPI0011A55FE4|nr:PaaI family thioesterase [Bordetella genomosp. 13]
MSDAPIRPAIAVPAQAGTPREAIEAVIARTPFAVWLGARLDAYGDGQATLSIALRPDLTMHHGFAHGAVLGFMADSACAWAAASVAGDVVTAEYKLNLLAPAVGKRLSATGRVAKVAGRLIVCQADVHCELRGRGTLVAIAQATITKFK